MSDMKSHIDEILRTRAEHIEMLAAAFIKRVGSQEASEYCLVEQRSDDGLETKWYFKRRSFNPAQRIFPLLCDEL